MTEIVIHCKHDYDDSIRVFRDSYDEIAFRNPGATVFTDEEGARTFARQLLELVGDETDTAAVRVGDRVVVTKYRLNDSTYDNRIGRLSSLDSDDIPYRVEFDGGGAAWAREVRKVTEPAPSSFAAHIDEAKRLLAGTSHNGADVIRLAEILAP